MAKQSNPGVKPEVTGIKEISYNIWHRELGQGYLDFDVNFVEYRNNRGIVALINVTANLEDESHLENSKEAIWSRSDLEREVLTEIANAIEVPAYYVIHTDDLQVFHVYELPDLKDFERMNQEEYTEFVQNL